MSTTATAPRHFALLSLPGAVGIAYTVSWIAGLSVGAPSPKFTDSGTEIVAQLSGHVGAVDAQYLLTEGLPAIGLAVLAVVLARATDRTGVARLAAGSGLIAAAISVTQCVLGFASARCTAPATAHLLFELVSRLDGVKMFALAALAVAGAASGLLATWLRRTALALAVAITASGVAYLLMVQSLAVLAYLSGVLLLIFVTGLGITLGRARR